MIQAIGLTSTPRKELPPAVDNVSIEALSGCVTVLLGAPGAGKTTAVRLMLALQQGRGITYFRGRPLHRIAHPSREVGVLLGDVPGHPARTVRGHLRMLSAATGVPVQRADDVLDVVGLAGLRDERLGTLSRGMDRRLGLACALLADPHTLVLDNPADGLSARESRWLHGILRAHALQGGTVLFTTRDPKEAAQTADRVITLESGRLVADQAAADFARTRLRPRVVVRSPHAVRLGALLTKEARTAHRSVEVVREDGNRLSVYGSSCADVGEAAFRHGILVHQLADEVGDMGPPPAAGGGSAASTGDADVTADDEYREGAPNSHARPPEPDGLPELPPPVSVRPAPSPLRPLRYELRRATGVGTGFLTVAAVLATSAVVSVILACFGHTPQPRLLAAWPQELPLPPAALGAGFLGAIAFGDEFRHPALAADRGTVPRRLGLLAAKLLVAAVTALMLAFLTVGCDLEVLYLVYGQELVEVPADWLPLGASWIGLIVGCSWAGVLAAGIFRSTTAGLAAVLAVPVLVVPLVHKVLERATVRTAAGFSARLHELPLTQWPFGGERYLTVAARMIAQPVGGALLLSLTTLLGAYLLTTLRSRVR
ncbi:ABC transporter ATP-binding protein [Streptomyces sp. NPDC046862]|uniref:ABC transporter ATP-binding protein n=1 Tax=Streptomyces sp. NPDC046862 TaxID=3154603 RepID=UPI00345198AD